MTARIDPPTSASTPPLGWPTRTDIDLREGTLSSPAAALPARPGLVDRRRQGVPGAPPSSPCGANQVFLLGAGIGESIVQRLCRALDRVDPDACVEIDIERGALKVGTPAAADDVLASLLSAGVTVEAWAAELPVLDGYARRTRRRAPAVTIQDSPCGVGSR